jgi:hypothetical protein
MALPNKTDLQTMNYVYQGQPFVSVSARSDIDTTTMDYIYLEQPFVTNPFGGSTPSSFNIHSARRRLLSL